MNGWTIESSRGEAHSFHHRPIDTVTEPTVWVHRVERPALVLGSSQRADIVDDEAAAAAGVEVCSRRSGGGLVLIEPGESCWIDVLIPPGHREWSDDVNQAFLWVGEVWHDALTALGVTDLGVHRGGIEHAAAGRFLCFAGLGPGEVVQQRGASVSKVVGLSQRRQRTVARFQGLFVNSSDLDLTTRLVAPSAWPHDLDATDLAIGVEPRCDPTEVAEAFIAALAECDA